MKRVTIKDVAKEAGVSVTLVSFVMNAKVREDGRLDCPVSAETAEKVLEVAKRLGYKRNPTAASLRSGRTNTIAVIPTDISNKFFAGLARYIEDRSNLYGYTVLFGSSDENAAKLGDVMDAVLAYNVDGIIVAPVAGGEKAIRKATDLGVPVVLLDRDIEGLDGVGKVILDDQEAGRMATEEFIRHGFKKIEMISYTLAISSLKEREVGYSQTMDAHGLSAFRKVHHTTYETVDHDIEIIIQDMLSRGVEAIFLPTYSLSAAALMVIKKKGLQVPQDLAVIGFDKSQIYRLFSTSVAHILQPQKEFGENAVDILHDMIENKSAGRSIVLKPTLIPGGSVLKD